MISRGPRCRSAQNAAAERRRLVIDDRAPVRDGFRMRVDAEEDMAVVGDAADGEAAAALAREHRLDVVLMDIRFLGPRATRRWRTSSA